MVRSRVSPWLLFRSQQLRLRGYAPRAQTYKGQEVRQRIEVGGHDALQLLRGFSIGAYTVVHHKRPNVSFNKRSLSQFEKHARPGIGAVCEVATEMKEVWEVSAGIGGMSKIGKALACCTLNATHRPSAGACRCSPMNEWTAECRRLIVESYSPPLRPRFPKNDDLVEVEARGDFGHSVSPCCNLRGPMPYGSSRDSPLSLRQHRCRRSPHSFLWRAADNGRYFRSLDFPNRKTDIADYGNAGNFFR
jgi:hypothetical protein